MLLVRGWLHREQESKFWCCNCGSFPQVFVVTWDRVSLCHPNDGLELTEICLPLGVLSYWLGTWFLNTSKPLPSQGLCTCYFLCLENSLHLSARPGDALLPQRGHLWSFSANHSLSTLVMPWKLPSQSISLIVVPYVPTACFIPMPHGSARPLSSSQQPHVFAGAGIW